MLNNTSEMHWMAQPQIDVCVFILKVFAKN